MVEIACDYVIAPRKTLRLELLFSNDPISFFGGVNTADGKVADYRHGNYQESMSNKAFAFPFGKGSSGAGLVLMEMMRLKTAPAASFTERKGKGFVTHGLFVATVTIIFHLPVCGIHTAEKTDWIIGEKQFQAYGFPGSDDIIAG